jgi:hypothetical protein
VERYRYKSSEVEILLASFVHAECLDCADKGPTHSETFDMAILMVKRNENAIRTKFSYAVSFVNRK